MAYEVISFGLSVTQTAPPDDLGRPYLEPVISAAGMAVTQDSEVFDPPRPRLEPVISKGGLSQVVDYDTAYEPHIIYHKSVTDKDTEV